MSNICMIGSGYVGLVTGACLADLGHNVICVDRDESKIRVLLDGGVPFYEPGLDELLARNIKAKRIRFTTEIQEGVHSSEIIFICVNTPPRPDGGADLSFVEACTQEVARYATGYKLLVEKSTVPVQTGARVQLALSRMTESKAQIEVASNPEFLREGSAISDFLNPDRIVIGVQSKKAEKQLRDLYRKIKAPVVVTNIQSAELIKHASNSFLAMKISYINAIAQLCEKVGADVENVALGMGLDKRIGSSFLNAGIGYGGSCFPKDVSAFIKIAEKHGYDFQMLRATEAVNELQRSLVVKKLEEILWTLKGKHIAIWGLAFKPNTDDLRNAPAIDIIHELEDLQVKVRAYDPVAMDRTRQQFPDIYYGSDMYDAAKGADALVIITEWNEFRRVNFQRLSRVMKGRIIIDGRNMFSPAAMAKTPFSYLSMGRPSVLHGRHS